MPQYLRKIEGNTQGNTQHRARLKVMYNPDGAANHNSAQQRASNDDAGSDWADDSRTHWKAVQDDEAGEAGFGSLVGRSRKMRKLFAEIQRVAPTDLGVLIEGETGAGKELVAEAIHQASHRARGPFIVFDCGAVAPTLAESELFGHERGAFTGAVNSRAGIFELARGGTVFLDELGELPKSLQPKLLRVLQKREVRRVGGVRSIPVDVRVVAATNRNLKEEVKRGEFREDLYFRIAVACLQVPALRERLEDLPLLVEHFLSLCGSPRRVNDISPHVWQQLSAHHWPGNVRELYNAVQRLVVTPDRVLDVADEEEHQEETSRTSSVRSVSAHSVDCLPLQEARQKAVSDFEREYLERVLERAAGNVTRAAAIAEVSRQMIQKLMRKHQIRTQTTVCRMY